jgi:choline dehydrogenase-like flavoprotein
MLKPSFPISIDDDRRRFLAVLAGAAAAPVVAAPAGAVDGPGRFEDAGKMPAAAILEADLCIIGAGAAGITLARAMADSGLSVMLLEAGSEQIDGRTQALCRWEQTGQPYYDLAACRLRYFGGTTNHWAGYSHPPQRADFDARPDIGVRGWPIGLDELTPFVTQAAASLGYVDAEFDPAVAARAAGQAAPLLDTRSPSLETGLFQIARRYRFAERHRAELAGQPRLRVVLNANVVHLQLDADATRVREVQVKSFDGPTLRVRASRWVLAAHALESARLLLVSDDVARSGIGNAHDQVGRCFMEHARVTSGVLVPTERFPESYDEQWGSARNRNWTLGLSEAVQRRHGVLQYQCRFLPIYAHDRARAAARRVMAGWWDPADLQTIKALGQLTGHPGDTFSLLARLLTGRRGRPLAYRLEHRIEQCPNPDSRLVLTAERDALGVRKAAFHWALNAVDEQGFAVGQTVLAEQLAQLGAGRVDAPGLTSDWIRERVNGLNHHTGTTRMSADPRHGVVDRDCRVHGVANLYVAGSGVFPRIGAANPTLLIMALALRLAEHLKRGGPA